MQPQDTDEAESAESEPEPDAAPMPRSASDGMATVARNTRRLRRARGWSLDQLAARSGVSKGMLVHLEQARTNPSLATLWKVAETLGVSVARLVELDDVPVVRIVPAEATVRLWTGAPGSHGDLLMGSDERDHVELWNWQFAPGEVHASEAHLEGTCEMLYVLSGTLTLDVAGGRHQVPAGAAAMYRADRPHAYRNDHKRLVRAVMVVLQPDADLEEWQATLP